MIDRQCEQAEADPALDEQAGPGGTGELAAGEERGAAQAGARAEQTPLPIEHLHEVLVARGERAHGAGRGAHARAAHDAGHLLGTGPQRLIDVEVQVGAEVQEQEHAQPGE